VLGGRQEPFEPTDVAVSLADLIRMSTRRYHSGAFRTTRLCLEQCYAHAAPAIKCTNLAFQIWTTYSVRVYTTVRYSHSPSNSFLQVEILQDKLSILTVHFHDDSHSSEHHITFTPTTSRFIQKPGVILSYLSAPGFTRLGIEQLTGSFRWVESFVLRVT
jgi:hypothetical protein